MDNQKVVSDYTSDFLSRLGFGSEVVCEVSFDPTQDNYLISLKTADPSLLIGFHGETLTAIRFALASHLARLFSAWPHVTVNVNDYNERRERSLYDLADSTVKQVLDEQRAYALPPLSPSDRRAIHVYLANHDQITTYSEGEGRTRTLIIAPK